MLWSFLTPILVLLLCCPETAKRWLIRFTTFNLIAIAFDYIHNQQDTFVYDIYQESILAFNGIGVGVMIYYCAYYLHCKHKQAIELLDQFSSLVAHELRNPLTSINLGIRHSLRQRAGLTTSQILALETAQAEANRSQLILTDLLQISRVVNSTSDLICQQFDPYPLLMSLKNQAQQQLGVNVQVHCSLDVCERLIWAAASPCRQVVWNLIENSAKYADLSHPIKLIITADLGDNYLEIQVADQGAQLSSQQCEAIFTPYYRIGGPKERPGSGLGLTLVRRCADAMGGSVSARPREEGGLLVSLVLPRATPSEWLQWVRCERERERESHNISPLPHDASSPAGTNQLPP